MHRRAWLWLIPLLLVMTWFGARGLDADPVWNDEWYMVRDVRVGHTPGAIAQHLAAQNPWHVPAYFVIMNPWGRIFDWRSAPMRALALFMGLGAVAWTYRLGRDHISPRVGLYAAAILASAGFFIHYTHELRMYTFNAMLTAFMIWFYLHTLRRKREPGLLTWVVMTAVATLMLYTHYFNALPLFAICLYHLLFVPKNRRWWKYVIALGIAGALFLPWVRVLLDVAGFAAGGYVRGVMTTDQLLGRITYLYGNGSILLVVVVALLAGLAVWRWRGERRQAAFKAWYFLLFVVGAIVLTNVAINVISASRMRYVVLLWPLLALVTAVGIAFLHDLLPGRRRLSGLVALTGLAIWMGYGYQTSLATATQTNLTGSVPNFPIHHVNRALRDIHAPGDYIAHIVPDDDEWHRYDHSSRFYIWNEYLAAGSGVLGELEKEKRIPAVTQAIGTGRHYVWVSYPPDPVPSVLDEFIAVLSQTYHQCGTAITTDEFVIDEYARSRVCCTPHSGDHTPQVTFARDMQLMGVDLLTDGDAGQLPVYVAWNASNRLPLHTYSVGLHVTDATGQLVAQLDYGLPADDFVCERQAIEIGQLPPGDYTVNALVYDWQTGERLPGHKTETNVTTDFFPLAHFSVSHDGDIRIFPVQDRDASIMVLP